MTLVSSVACSPFPPFMFVKKEKQTNNKYVGSDVDGAPLSLQPTTQASPSTAHTRPVLIVHRLCLLGLCVTTRNFQGTPQPRTEDDRD